MCKRALIVILAWVPSTLAEPPSRELAESAHDAAKRATEFFRTKVATRGGYLWRYSADLKIRKGEGNATETQIWVQPPGTPAVGMAYLRMYEATGNRRYLDAARAAADALVWGQLASGGWTQYIDFSPEGARRLYYRRDFEAGKPQKRRQRNVSTFDDDKSQSALRLLMRVDQALEFKNATIRDAAEYAIQFFLAAQFPNGAWPQGTDGPVDQTTPIRKARYPDSWSRTAVGSDYWNFYTLNDNTQRDCILTMLEAHEIYDRQACLEVAKRGGDFLILAQMPEPQPAWAQQYNFEMEPIWARRFEPPAISGGESAGVIRVLADLFVVTGEKKYLKPLPAAIAWYHRSSIGNSRWARFYELRTNQPLYFTKKYELVYTDDNLPTHYSFQGEYGVETAIRHAEHVLREGRVATQVDKRSPTSPDAYANRAKRLETRVQSIVADLDEQGRWISDGWIECRTFVSNLNTLADYLEAVRLSSDRPKSQR